MSNLLASLLNSSSTLQAYGRVLESTQNNVSNASTPGYAKQAVDLLALPFDPAAGSTGGVRAGALISSRNEFAETAVRQQSTTLGYQQQTVASLSSLESRFDITGNSGIPKALNSLLGSFAEWGSSPDTPTTRQTVLDRASELASTFRQAFNALSGQERDAEQQIHETVDQVNKVVGQLAKYNHVAMQGGGSNAGLSAGVHSSLDQLSQYVDFTANFQSDGTVSVTLNGQTPLLIGDQQFTLTSGLAQPQQPPPIYADAPARARILGADGTDLTAATTGGQLGALLEVRNHVLPSYLGDSYQPGDLNRMAKQFAERVNQVLTSGRISDGPPPQAGVPLFTFDATNDTTVAGTLAVDPAMTQDQLAAIDAGPPYVSNGIPLALSKLAAPITDADRIDGVGFSEFYGQLAGRAGGKLSDSKNAEQVQQSLVAQAKSLRQQYSGVSLDEEATILIQFQRAYQANSRFITILDQLTQDAINLIK